MAERLAGGTEHRDLAHAGFQRRIQPLAVGHQHRVVDAGVRHEGAGLDAAQAAGGQLVDQIQLGGQRDGVLFILQPVARADFDDFYVGHIEPLSLPRNPQKPRKSPRQPVMSDYERKAFWPAGCLVGRFSFRAFRGVCGK
ncbi:hypothetical protein D3C78_1470770 [compost metagenome]